MNTPRPVCTKCNMPFPPNNGADDGHIGWCDSCWKAHHPNGKDCPDCHRPKKPTAQKVTSVADVMVTLTWLLTLDVTPTFAAAVTSVLEGIRAGNYAGAAGETLEAGRRRVFEVSAVGHTLKDALDGVEGGWFAHTDVPREALQAARAHNDRVFKIRMIAELVSEYPLPPAAT